MNLLVSLELARGEVGPGGERYFCPEEDGGQGREAAPHLY